MYSDHEEKKNQEQEKSRMTCGAYEIMKMTVKGNWYYKTDQLNQF